MKNIPGSWLMKVLEFHVISMLTLKWNYLNGQITIKLKGKTIDLEIFFSTKKTCSISWICFILAALNFSSCSISTQPFVVFYWDYSKLFRNKQFFRFSILRNSRRFHVRLTKGTEQLRCMGKFGNKMSWNRDRSELATWRENLLQL